MYALEKKNKFEISNLSSHCISIRKSKRKQRDFPGGSLVAPVGSLIKNPPANAADLGSVPGPARSHLCQSNNVRAAPQLLSLFSTTRETPSGNHLHTSRE